MARVKLKHFAEADMVSDPEWGQAMEVAVKYIEKKISRLNHCGALDESVFGMRAAEHFVFGAFDKLYTGEWEWNAHRAPHTQLVKIALSDISHHLRNSSTSALRISATSSINLTSGARTLLSCCGEEGSYFQYL